MLYPDPLHGNIRYRVGTFGVVAAGAVANNLLVTPDDARPRLVTGIMGTAQLIGIRYQLVRAGYLVAEYDASVFNNAAGYMPLDALFPIGIQVQLNVNNTSAGGSVAAAINFRYELLNDPMPA